MNVNRDIYLEGENFHDFITVKNLECFRCALIWLIQTNMEGKNVNKLFFIAMVKKLAERCSLENLNPSMLKLQQSCQPEQPVSETLHAFDNIGFLGYVKNKVKNFLRKKMKRHS